MAKVTSDDVIKINEEYYKCHCYAEVARRTGFSASTVKKYVRPDYTPLQNVFKVEFNKPLPLDYIKAFLGVENYGTLCLYSDKEYEEIKELWEEMSI